MWGEWTLINFLSPSQKNVGHAQPSILLWQKRSAVEHGPSVREHLATAGLARAGAVPGSGHTPGSEPKASLLIGRENLDKSARASDSGCVPAKMEIICVPY